MRWCGQLRVVWLSIRRIENGYSLHKNYLDSVSRLMISGKQMNKGIEVDT